MTGSLGRRYARALLGLAREANAFDRTSEQLAQVTATLMSADVRSVVTNPALPASNRRAVVERIVERCAVSPAVGNLVRLLADRDRVGIRLRRVRDRHGHRDPGCLVPGGHRRARRLHRNERSGCRPDELVDPAHGDVGRGSRGPALGVERHRRGDPARAHLRAGEDRVPRIEAAHAEPRGDAPAEVAAGRAAGGGAAAHPAPGRLGLRSGAVGAPPDRHRPRS